MLQELIKLNAAFKELVYQVKESLFLQQNISGKKTRSSYNKHGPSSTKQSLLTSHTKASFSSPRSPALSPSTNSMSSGVPHMNSGLNLHNVDSVVEILAELTSRAEKILEIDLSLSQLYLLKGRVVGLPCLAGLWNIEDTSIDALMASDEDKAPTSASSKDSLDQDERENGEEELDKPVQFSDSPSDSVAYMVTCFYRAMTRSLLTGCPDAVLVIHGRGRGVFPVVYLEYCKLLGRMESNMAKYLTVSCL